MCLTAAPGKIQPPSSDRVLTAGGDRNGADLPIVVVVPYRLQRQLSDTGPERLLKPLHQVEHLTLDIRPVCLVAPPALDYPRTDARRTLGIKPIHCSSPATASIATRSCASSSKMRLFSSLSPRSMYNSAAALCCQTTWLNARPLVPEPVPIQELRLGDRLPCDAPRARASSIRPDQNLRRTRSPGAGTRPGSWDHRTNGAAPKTTGGLPHGARR